MARLSIEHLAKLPRPGAHEGKIPPLLLNTQQISQKREYWGEFCVSQDLTRAHLASKAADAAINPSNKAKATGLAVKLNYATHGDGLPHTCASSAYMEVHRQAISHWLPLCNCSGPSRTPGHSVVEAA